VYEAQTRISRRRFRCRFNAHALFGSRGRPKFAVAKPAPFQMQIQCPRDPSPRRGCGQHSATTAWPGQRPAPPVHHAKNPARPSAPTGHTRQRIKPSLCRLGIQSEQISETHRLAAARPAAGIDPVAARCSSQRRQPDWQKRTRQAEAANAPPTDKVHGWNLGASTRPRLRASAQQLETDRFETIRSCTIVAAVASVIAAVAAVISIFR
jgi:hypothetical protein